MRNLMDILKQLSWQIFHVLLLIWLLPIMEHFQFFWRQRSISYLHSCMAYLMAGDLLSCLLRRLMAFFISSITELSIWHSRPIIPSCIHSHRIRAGAGPVLSCARGPCLCCKWGPSCSTDGVISLVADSQLLWWYLSSLSRVSCCACCMISQRFMCPVILLWLSCIVLILSHTHSGAVTPRPRWCRPLLID